MAGIKLVNRPTIARVNELFTYDPETGIVLRRMASGKLKAAVRVTIKVDGAAVELSHLVWALAYGEWPTTLVDHADGNRQNLRKKNLRLATTMQNAYNSTKNGAITANVQFKRDSLRSFPWFVRVRAGGKRHVFGGYATKAEALAVAEQKKVELHGEFAAHLSRT